MTTAIIATSDLNINQTTPAFQDERLNKATDKIIKLYQNATATADKLNRQLASILGTVATEKSYEKDGFKSVGEYASMTFGIKPRNAYMLASAGQVYNDEKANPVLKSMSPSKMAEVLSIDREALNKALEDGTITNETTQKDLRKFAESVEPKTPRDTKENKYTARLCTEHIPEEIALELTNPRTENEWDEFFSSWILSMFDETTWVDTIKIPKGKVSKQDDKATLTRKLYTSRRFSIVVEFWKHEDEKHKKEKKTKKATPQYTREELEAMLAALNDTQE